MNATPMTKNDAHPAFAPLVSECAKHGISKTVAYELAGKGLIETFHIGTRRYVVLASLHSLPSRMLFGEGVQVAAA